MLSEDFFLSHSNTKAAKMAQYHPDTLFVPVSNSCWRTNWNAFALCWIFAEVALKWKVNERFLSIEAVDTPDGLTDKPGVIWWTWNESENVQFSSKASWLWTPLQCWFIFWMSQNNVTGSKIIKYLFTSQGSTSHSASPSSSKWKKFTTFDRDLHSKWTSSKRNSALQVSTDTSVMQLHLSMLHLQPLYAWLFLHQWRPPWQLVCFRRS